MARTPEIKVKIGADTTELDRGLSSAESRLSTFARVGAAAAGAAVAAVAVAMVSLTRESLANIDATTKQARSLGLTTSALQTMSLVANEAGVESGKLSSILGLMQRNIQELADGTQTQVDAFASLGLSITDLQGLEADVQFDRIATALDAIEDPTLRTARAMELFGRGGRDAINMLENYSARAADAELFQRRFGIAVSQTAAEDVERANDAVGRLGMVMEGLGNRMATAVAPAIEATANALIDFAGSVVGAETSLEAFFGTLENARATLGDRLFDQMFGDVAQITENNAALNMLAQATMQFANDAGIAATEMDNFAGQLDRLGQIGAAEVMRQYAEQMQRAAEQHADGTITGEEFRAKVDEIEGRARALVEQMALVDGVNFDAVLGRLTGLQAGLDATRGAAEQLIDTLIQAMPMTTGTPLDEVALPQDTLGGRRSQAPRRAPMGDTLDAPSAVAGMGGGSAIVDLFAERLEALEDGLQTEAEVVAEWYENGLLTLESARERGLLTEERYMELRERLEEEHQDRLGQIREIGNQSALSMAMGAGEEILSAIGAHNKKAMRIAKVFGAAQALISAYQGAAEALKLPFPGNMAAAATVLAKGIGFVSAIRSVNEGSSGGGSPASTGTSTATSTTQAPLQVSLNTFGVGDLISRADLGGLLDSLNAAAGDRGYNILRPA